MTHSARALMPILPKPLRKKTTNIMYLFANGLSPERIAELTGVSETRVRWILESQRGRAEAAQMAYQVAGEDPRKMFMKAVPETFAVQMEIMRKPGAKDSTRLVAAEAIQNRAMGKAPQTIEVNQKSTVRLLLEQLQGSRAGNEIAGKPWDIEAQWREVEIKKALESHEASTDTAGNDDYNGL
jgi:transcriptional regulator with XRE-family HTH domain